MILVGLSPSWSLLSSHTFLTVASVFSVVWVLVIVYSVLPSFAVTVLVQPAGTLTSSTVQLMAVLFAFFASFVQVWLQLFAALSTTGSPLAFPSAFSCTLMLSGLIPSWLSLSVHTFLTLTLVSSVEQLFVRVVTVPSFAVSVRLQPSGIFPSLQLYTISVPFAFFGRFCTVAAQPLSSFRVTVVTTVFPFIRLTLRLSGLFPSWSLLSFHTFLTVASVVSVVWVLVIT